MLYLLIEFLDELVFGVHAAAWPAIRDELALTYVQIGLAASLPGLIAAFIEPFLGILGDVWRRRVLILAGGVFFTLALLLTSTASTFYLLLFSFILFFPSSGAFVSLSQASLMDSAPDRHDQNMARWTFAGSLGVVAGPVFLGLAAFAGVTWRGVYLGLAILSFLGVIGAWRSLPPDPDGRQALPRFSDVFLGLRKAFEALRNKTVLRWLVLLEFSDLMLDVLYGYLALYFVDVVGLTAANAAFAVAVWTGVGLLGDFLIIPLLERLDGLVYLRVSVLAELILFPAFLLVPIFPVKLALLGLMGMFNAGWYAILRGRLYSAMPGQSGTVMALDNITGLAGSLLPLGIGLAAETFGLGPAMWLMLAGPIALLIGLPRSSPKTGTQVNP
jgi:FSR family fosmidomycin resistance protein-like MFS transporter